MSLVPTSRRPMKARCAILLLFSVLCVGDAHALNLISDSETITAVSAKVFNNYSRQRMPDGSFKSERYALGDGGLVRIRLGALQDASQPTMMVDDTVDNMTFQQVVGIIKGPLADEKYIPSQDPIETDLLVMVFWGLTVGGINFTGPDRDKVDQVNAAVLGYNSEIIFSELDGLVPRTNLLKEIHADVISSIEPNRYWVVLRAFDFQSSWKQKKLKLLWETRFSLSQRRHDFGKDLLEMTSVASKYFGQDTHGLVRRPLPEGRVDLGDVKSLGEVQKGSSDTGK